MKMRAALTLSKGEPFVIDEVDIATPKKTEVLVKISGVGVCHTDAIARDQIMPVPLPAVLGHEGSGVVHEVGNDVVGIKRGDHVVLSFYSCGHCEWCLTGHPNMCNDYARVNLLSGAYADGTKRISKNGVEFSCFFAQSSFAEYAIADQRNCVVIDKDVNVALMGPLGCGIQTGAGVILNKLKAEVGSSIAVFGCGAVGLSAIMMAKTAGCATIIGVDAVESRLELAKELGATHAINGKEVEDTVAEITKITGQGADYSLDTSAVPELINQAIFCLKRQGVCVAVGATGDKIVPLKIQYAIMRSGRTLTGVVEGDSIPQLFIPKLVNLHKIGKFPFDKLIKEFKFDQINEAFEDSHHGGAIKPILIL
jgi:aryl-alcohol dehydrogenase